MKKLLSLITLVGLLTLASCGKPQLEQNLATNLETANGGKWTIEDYSSLRNGYAIVFRTGQNKKYAVIRNGDLTNLIPLYHVGYYPNSFYVDAGRNQYSEETTIKKDLESLGANKESLDNEELSYNLEENYGLSEERAASVAKITSSFKKIQNKRSLTSKEMNIYTQKVLGVNYDAGKKALEAHIQGDSADMEAMMERAADVNGTSPEAVTELVGEYLLN